MLDVKNILKKQREYFLTGITKDIDFRTEKLNTLKRAINSHQDEILAALKKDLNKSGFEAYATEVGILLDEINYVVKHLRKWIKPQRVRTPITHFPSSSFIYSEPYGVSLIIAPWNYPFQLAIAPLVGSIAAGNCAVVKPSEYSPHTSELLSRIIARYFDEQYIAVVQGDNEVSKSLLEEQFDYIFFTGSVPVGRIVMQAAAKHLTPVTLELGGKSPCIVDREVDIDLAARRITWGKFINCGQTCVAPDYLLVHKDVKKDLVTHIGKYIKQFYGENPLKSPDYVRVINQRHFKRLKGFLNKGNIITGGYTDEKSLYIAPTVIDGITWDDDIMQDEIFGPILPVLEYDNLSEVITTVNDNPKPLALYFFSNNKRNQKIVLRDISFGGGCINDTIIHLATPHLPFGGVGNSGLGAYHGKMSFEAFSHKKSILKKSNLLDIPLRYPPYKNKLRLLKRVLK
ncbi:MAG: aldehyde dehydrogenase [Clostridia bacterium]|nr:aldehyde dehydrogenase [Clostridia bacterium]